MISELRKVCQKNVDMISVKEDIQRVKNAIDLAQRDIMQKTQVAQEIKGEVEEINEKNEELEEEIKAYEEKFAEQEGELDLLTNEA